MLEKYIIRSAAVHELLSTGSINRPPSTSDLEGLISAINAINPKASENVKVGGGESNAYIETTVNKKWVTREQVEVAKAVSDVFSSEYPDSTIKPESTEDIEAFVDSLKKALAAYEPAEDFQITVDEDTVKVQRPASLKITGRPRHSGPRHCVAYDESDEPKNKIDMIEEFKNREAAPAASTPSEQDTEIDPTVAYSPSEEPIDPSTPLEVFQKRARAVRELFQTGSTSYTVKYDPEKFLTYTEREEFISVVNALDSNFEYEVTGARSIGELTITAKIKEPKELHLNTVARDMADLISDMFNSPGVRVTHTIRVWTSVFQLHSRLKNALSKYSSNTDFGIKVTSNGWCSDVSVIYPIDAPAPATETATNKDELDRILDMSDRIQTHAPDLSPTEAFKYAFELWRATR